LGYKIMAMVISTSTAIEQAEAAGFDMSLIDVSLSYTHERRALQHQAALDLALELAKAGQQLRDRSQPIDRKALRR
jgi:hypothetical protein